MLPILLVIVGAAAAGFVQGLSGFAFGLVAMAFWVWAVPPQLLGPMVVFGSLVGQLIGMGKVRRGFDLARASPFILGGMAGIPLGVAILGYIDPDWFKFCVGLLLVVYCPVMLFMSGLPHISAGGRVADGLVGAIGGVMGGLGGLTGPAPTLWCSLRGWPKDQQRAVFQSFNLTMHVLTLAAYAAAGMLTAQAGHMFLIVASAMVVPTLAGAWLYGKADDRQFRTLVLALLGASGLAMLAAALPGIA
ncbi:sulfite exporter TauE/SafE family protein [Arenibaculum sp.]|uniref:sulfite exporter TauE/SafE family protein n=1 Tax=Arenibaculum sp. TaxID=2865862 RepID=UPI002E0D0F67|nr:sulfite exporter TauE/SafE family protein [Arenibaculum sp.]